MNKYPTSNGNIGNLVQARQTNLAGNTLNSRNELRNTKSKMKTNTQTGGFGIGNI